MKPKPVSTTKIIILCSLASLLASCGPTAGSDSADAVQARIAAVENGLLPAYQKTGATPAGKSIGERMAHYFTPAVSIAVVNNGRIEWAKGYGVTTSTSTDAVTADHLFQACSISKPVAAVGVMLLSQAGSITIDRSVNDYLTSWKVADNTLTTTEKVTVRRLLSHTGGISVSGFAGYQAGQALPSLLQILNGAAPAENPPVVVEAQPGSAYSYSGGGMEILQQMVEDVSGASFKDFMNDRLFTQLGMTSSAFLQPLSGPLATRAVSAHDYAGVVIPGHWKTYPELAAAGLWTTPSDLARVVIEVQQAAIGKGSTLSAATAHQMLTTQASDADGPKMGLGFEVKPLGGDIKFSHTGSNIGFKTYLIGYRNSGKGAVVMTNSESGGLVMLEIMRSIAKVYGWPDMLPEARDLIDVAPGVLATYVGSYGPPGGASFYEVAMSGTQLAIKIAGLAVFNELYAVAADNFIFFSAAGSGSLAFTRNTAGQVAGLNIHLAGASATGLKK